MSRNFPPHMSAESPSNISPNLAEVLCTLRQLLKITPLSAQKTHSAGKGRFPNSVWGPPLSYDQNLTNNVTETGLSMICISCYIWVCVLIRSWGSAVLQEENPSAADNLLYECSITNGEAISVGGGIEVI